MSELLGNIVALWFLIGSPICCMKAGMSIEQHRKEQHEKNRHIA
ncbi:hypothetical protein [Bifidobacterium tibiigranuli]|jgi:hypothetical protein|nr:hypothetical protein [Bifidobacterium tibiigranuli]